MHYLKSLIVLITLFVSTASIASAEPKPLDKTDAAKIIASMGYERINIAYIVHGFARVGFYEFPPIPPLPLSSPTLATVTFMGALKGKVDMFDIAFRYDNDLGWFYTENEVDDKGQKTKLRIWSVSGYSTVTPAASPK